MTSLVSRIASFFTSDKALLDKRKEHLSPSGKYRLVITPFTTGKGTWNYTEGLVFEIGNDTPIAEVQRNYSGFPFLWVEKHPRGAFLVCGSDYQGQTVIELNTGKRLDFLPEAAKKGHGFCWVEYTFDQATQMLIVDGCVWACPYEYRLFDFSDPMSGWPEIESEHCLYSDPKKLTLEADGTIKWYETFAEDEDDDIPVEQREVASIRTFKRDGLKLVLTDEWVSEPEKERRAKYEEAERRHKEKMRIFRSSDPLYLTFSELAKDPELTPEGGEWLGITHPGWCPTFEKSEQRIGKRIINGGKPYTIELDWAMDTGPIRLEIYKDGKHLDKKFFPHSVEGMQDAFSYVKELLHG